MPRCTVVYIPQCKDKSAHYRVRIILRTRAIAIRIEYNTEPTSDKTTSYVLHENL